MRKKREGKWYFLGIAIIDLGISLLCLFTFFRFQPGTFFYFFVLIIGILAFLVGIFYIFLFLLSRGRARSRH